MPLVPICGWCWFKQIWIHENNLKTKQVETWLMESHHRDCPRASRDGERHLILSRDPKIAMAP